MTSDGAGKQKRRFTAPPNTPLRPHRNAAKSAALEAQIAADAADAFANDHEQIKALTQAGVMIASGIPLPPNIARWIAGGIAAYVNGEAKSLDAALHLDAPGKAHPLRAAKDRQRTEELLFMMQVLHMMGATIPQAAAMVRAHDNFLDRSTLEDRYARSGRGKDALQERNNPNLLRWEAWIAAWVDPLPDDGGDAADKLNPIRLGKANIKGLYAKALASRT